MRVTTGNAPGCAEEGPAGAGPRAHRVRGVRVLPGCERTRPVPSLRTCTRPRSGDDRPALSRGRVVLRYLSTEPTALAAAASPGRRKEGREWVTRSSELNPRVTSAPGLVFVMYVPRSRRRA
ncbi:hypothetical protein STVIR_1249 [Streptomyces viridochromogenes Tue57]|uniref:Uncharacterized protein n=1 Tax=Streptomyces viridochromogenes Tue57 TaxID=1160705 RepID=L8PMS2_STRVR|nr:hypothetical protein STVIR_1249 [Streptomyces viridochromogenes Tue57]